MICLQGNFLTNNYEEILLYLWNPATMTLSNKIEFRHSSTDTYKIVAFHLMTNEVKVLSFGDNVWRNFQCLPMVPTYRAPRFYKHAGIKHGVWNS
jgi:hypothetical protein